MNGWAMGLEGWLLMAAWAAVMILVVLLLVREPRHTVGQDAAAILRARFARGELTEQEYRHAASILDVDPDQPPAAADHAARHATLGQEARHD